MHGRTCVALTLRDDPPLHDVTLIAIGKAASAMTLGALDVLPPASMRRGLVITKAGHVDEELRKRPCIQFIEAGHPLPNQRSLDAGRALIDLIQSLPDRSHILFLISGGASSLVEQLPAGISLDDVRRANAWLLSSGLSITAMNRVRISLSLIKGGRLRTLLGKHVALALVISDVPTNDVRVVGSGLLSEPEAVAENLFEIPEWLRALQQRAGESSPCAIRVKHRIVADLRIAMRAIAEMASARGIKVHMQQSILQGDAIQRGREMAQQLGAGMPGLYMWGGETTVTLPPTPGRGGRNQSLALAAAEVLQGRNDVVLLAVGTDGTDGSSNDAGAIVDGGTIMRGARAGLCSSDALVCADAGTFLAASGDVLHTGPTGTNVMDLVLGWRGVT